MRSRGYNKRVEIYQTTLVPDTFGGNTVSDVLINNSWCNIETLKNSKLITDLGLIYTDLNLTITLRNRLDIIIDPKTMYFKYRDEKYVIKSNPTNINFKDDMLKFIITREQINIIQPILNNIDFTYTFPFKLA